MARITTCTFAYAVGEVRVATYVGCRPTSEGNPSVHLSDAKNPGAINYFNYSFSIPFQEQLQTLCSQMGSVFGLGFYIHDFLPCRQTGRLFVSESGFKLGPGPAVKQKYWDKRNQIPPFSGFFSAEHIFRALRFHPRCSKEGILEGVNGRPPDLYRPALTQAPYGSISAGQSRSG
jgi:hypothetical protein